jgi:hypothetical protein
MRQSFPSFADEHAAFIEQLANETAKLLTTSYEVPNIGVLRRQISLRGQAAWVALALKGKYADFVPLANAFDRIEAEAEARKERGEAPLHLIAYVHCPFARSVAHTRRRRGADPTLSFPAQTADRLRQEIDNVRELRADVGCAHVLVFG